MSENSSLTKVQAWQVISQRYAEMRIWIAASIFATVVFFSLALTVVVLAVPDSFLAGQLVCAIMLVWGCLQAACHYGIHAQAAEIRRLEIFLPQGAGRETLRKSGKVVQVAVLLPALGLYGWGVTSMIPGSVDVNAATFAALIPFLLMLWAQYEAKKV